MQSESLLIILIGSMNNSFLFRKNAGNIFDDFLERESVNMSEEYRQLILSCSGIIKISYFDKIEWSAKAALECHESGNWDNYKDNLIARRAAYYLSDKSFAEDLKTKKLYSDFRYAIMRNLWFAVELFRTVLRGGGNKFNTDMSCQGGILIIVSQQYQYERLISLINQITDAGNMVTILCGFPINIKTKSSVVRYVNIGYGRSLPIFSKILRSFSSYYRDLSSIKKKLNVYRSRCLGVNSVIEALLIESFVKWNYDHLLQSIRSRELSVKVIEEIRPFLVYSIDPADPTARIVEKVAQDKKIKTYCMSFSFQDEYSQYWTRRAESRYGAINSTVALLVKKQTDTKYNVDILGDPSYDSFKCNKSASIRIRTQLGIRQEDKIALFVSYPVTSAEVGVSEGQYNAEEYRSMLETMIAAASQNKAYLIIKPHPVDNNNIQKIINQYCVKNEIDRSRVCVASRYGVKDLICATDIVVGIHSTVSFETILLEKRYLLLQWKDLPDLMSLIKNNVCMVSYSKNDLNNVLSDSFHNIESRYDELSRKKYLKDMYVYPYDKSTDRFMVVFKKLLTVSDENSSLS